LAIGTTSTTAKAGNWKPSSADISDASAVGKGVLTAEDAETARTAIGAGTSSLTIGTTSTTAKAGNYAPAWVDVSGKPTTFTPPTATATVVGGVKQAEVTPLVASGDATAVEAADAVVAAGDTPTKAEFDAVVTELVELRSKHDAELALINELKTKVNSLINNGRSAGQAASS
jgi:hypothetical protein